MKFLGSKELVTERLVLKAQTMEEQHYLWSVLMLDDVNKYYLSVPQKFREKLKDWTKQEEFYRKDMERANDPDVFRWSVFLKETGECIGRVSCHDARSEFNEFNDHGIRGVGWYIDPKFKGNGYATEAAKAMIDYMFNECEISEIHTQAAVENPASWKIMEKLGFIRKDKINLVEYTYLDEPAEDYQYYITKEMYLEKSNDLNKSR